MKKNINTIFFHISIFLFIFSQSIFYRLVDLDYWARLLQGKAFFELGHILFKDPFSYTTTNDIWLDHEWGSSLIFYFMHEHFGYWGMLMTKAILMYLIFLFIFKTIELHKPISTKMENILFFFFGIHFMQVIVVQAVRCHVFSFALFALFVYILELVRIKGKDKLLILLPILMILWTNIHGGCVAGLGLIGMYLVGEFINKRPCKKYLITCIAASAATFINPYGIEYVKFLLVATTMPRVHISEWDSPFTTPFIVTKTGLVLFTVVMILAFIKDIINRKTDKIDYTKYIVLVVTDYLACSHIKQTPFFVMTSLMFLYDDFFFFFNKILNSFLNVLHLNIPKFRQIFVALKEGLLYFFIISASLISILSEEKTPQMFLFPEQSVEFMRINELKGNILCEFGSGSYISYKLYPNNLIYMDGRYEEVYPENVFDDLLAYVSALPTWENVFTKHPMPDYIMLPTSSEYGRAKKKMEMRTDYKIIYSEPNCDLYARVDLIKDNYKLPSEDKEYYKKHIFDIYFNFTDNIEINGEKVIFK